MAGVYVVFAATVQYKHDLCTMLRINKDCKDKIKFLTGSKQRASCEVDAHVLARTDKRRVVLTVATREYCGCPCDAP